MERYSLLFSSNAVLEPAEVTAVREDIKVRTKTIDQLELQLQSLDIGSGKIEAERRGVLLDDNVVAERDALGRLLTPLRGFPVEILSEIFIAVYRAAGVDEKVRRVVDLCSVCRLWRSAAVGTTQLWSYIWLENRHVDGFGIDRISRWFARSGVVARHLEMQCLDCGSEHEHEQEEGCKLSSIFINLFTHGPFLYKLSLNSVNPTCLQSLARRMKDTQCGRGDRAWDSLGELRIHITTSHWIRRTITLSQMLLDLPTVRSFHLMEVWYNSGVLLPRRYPTTNAMLESLTMLTIENLGLFTTLELLLLCSSLQELAVDLGEFRYHHFQHQPPIPLPNLLVLRLKTWPPRHVTTLQDLLHTPALVEFSVSLSDDETERGRGSYAGSGGDIAPNDRVDLVNGLTTFLQQSKATVQRLRLENFGISSHGLTRLLVSLPSVTHLTLDWVMVDRSIFRPAHYSDTQLLPRLESLHLAPVYEEFPLPEVCEFFMHRFDIPLPTDTKTLKVLTFELDRKRFRDYDEEPEHELRKAVSKLRMLGVDVFVNRSQWG